MSFIVAIVGRPNVGKSTLFNRLAGKKLALVDDQPGLTRDRREAETEFGSCSVTLIDTAGLEPGDQGLTPRMRQQTEAAIAQADLVLFLIDARAGVVPADEIFADLVRGSGKPVILAANKCEGRAAEPGSTRPMRSVLASRCRFPPSTASASASSPRSSSMSAARAMEQRRSPQRMTMRDGRRRTLCASPSSAGRMSANRRSSTRCSARSA